MRRFSGKVHKIARIGVVALLTASCSQPPVDSGDAGVDDATVSTDVQSTEDTAATPETGGGEGGNCAEIGERFIEAVRGFPRECAADYDCEILPRAQVCDCDLAVARGTDKSTYDAVRAEADAAQCSNAFGCPPTGCPYVKLSEPGELYPRCNDEGRCEIVQVMTCEEFEQKADGGMVGASSCMMDTDCALRNDLNFCNCNEAVSSQFPALLTQSIYDVLRINGERCDVTCEGCQSPGGTVCALDDEGLRTCQTN